MNDDINEFGFRQISNDDLTLGDAPVADAPYWAPLANSPSCSTAIPIAQETVPSRQLRPVLEERAVPALHVAR